MDNFKTEFRSESSKLKSKKIPSGLKPVLWSKNINNLDLIDDKVYIIHQVLSYGSIGDIKILFKIYSRNEIEEVFIDFPKKIYTRPVFLFLKDFLLKIDSGLEENKYVKSFTRSVR